MSDRCFREIVRDRSVESKRFEVSESVVVRARSSGELAVVATSPSTPLRSRTNARSLIWKRLSTLPTCWLK